MSTCKPLARIHLATRPTSHLQPLIQARHESTTRRHRKLLALPEAPSFTPSSRKPTLIFNPPSAAPSVYHTPLKFLPKDDRRKQLYAAFQTQSTQTSYRKSAPSIAQPGTPLYAPTSAPSPSYPQPAAHLPPRPSAALPAAVRAPYEKKYHLDQNDIKEIQRLRKEDPDHWTRWRLAEKFACSNFFIGLVAKDREKAGRVEREHEAARGRWGTRRREAREDRGRRKALWGRDA
ncbi:hypothetical protein P280DRAFT_169832 [Massarina eburnea CBS 473.64]|uniref:60S ribosomal protein L20 n=1 Tax=Massarina eburnea CBS 473.64 TaxID=1395130 RepID=A0A6A6RKX6_9PLEO|nr:hypothetical protein P280DRAFT_169832 [Massarina eburnea CBS 473.64]